MVNIVYCILTIPAIVMVLLSFKKTISKKIIYPALCLLTVRNCSRLYDHELSRNWMKMSDIYNLMVMQVIVSFILILTLATNFVNIRFSVYINTIILIYFLFGINEMKE